MALFNYTAKEITVKVVYYGPGLRKTTNLQYLHHTINSGKKENLSPFQQRATELSS
jgi:hypothetical protein